MARHVVGTTHEIPVGGRKMVEIAGREIGIFNVKGEYYALLNRCPHEGAPMCKGKVIGFAVADEPGKYRLIRQGEILRCPWHGWEYDIKTGQSWVDPEDIKVRSFNVKVEDGETLARGPYVAESFEVKVEDTYLVIDL